MIVKKIFSPLIFLILLLIFSFSKGLKNTEKSSFDTISGTVGYDVVKIINRNFIAYTQGLFFDTTGNYLYESGGLYSSSAIRKLKYPSLEINISVPLDDNYFAEGIAKCGNNIYQLTWRENIIFKYNLEDLKLLGKIKMDTKMREGWGLAEYQNGLLIATDGSSNIFFLDCNNNLRVKNTINVFSDKGSLQKLNALVYAKGFIYANVYFSGEIFKIDPKSGKVLNKYDMINLVQYELDKKTLTKYRLNDGEVLNGIAYDKNRDIFLVTGKHWGYVYEVKFE